MTPFGHYLEKLRRSRNLQQKQMADAMEVNPCYISSLERGRKKPPSRDVLNKLIERLKLTGNEELELWRAVELSEPSFRLPHSMSLEEFEFVHELRGSLGNLSHNQLVIMRKTLELGAHKDKDLRAAGGTSS